MSKLLTITGISGTGKTTLAKMLYQKIDNSVMLSFDKLSENIYDMLGFQNKQEKRKLQKFRRRKRSSKRPNLTPRKQSRPL